MPTIMTTWFMNDPEERSRVLKSCKKSNKLCSDFDTMPEGHTKFLYITRGVEVASHGAFMVHMP